jgi:hypothetical protein
MSIESLLNVMPPPTAPIESGNKKEWSSIEASIGTTLPEDFKEYINLYGTGKILRFLWPFNPFSKNDNLNLGMQLTLQLDALRELKDEFGFEECPYPLYPEPEGLLPWGVTDNGDVLFWLTDGIPENWPIIVNEGRVAVYERYDESMTSFLSKLLSKNIISKIFPDDLCDRNPLPLFEPYG